MKKNDENAFGEYCDKFKHSRNVVLDADKIKAYYFYLDKNNQVRIDLQDLSEGIPFDSFSFVLKKQMEIDDALSLYQNQNSDE